MSLLIPATHYPHCNDRCVGDSHWMEASPEMQKMYAAHPLPVIESDAPACPSCGSLMVRTGSCHTCQVCGTNTGCG